MVAHQQKFEFGNVGLRVPGEKPFCTKGENQRKTERTCIPWAAVHKSFTRLETPRDYKLPRI